MKTALSLFAIFLFLITSSAQSRTISKNQYEKDFEFAVAHTNAAYPVILKVTTIFIENGKRVRTVTELMESDARSNRRIKRTDIAGGRTTNKYQVAVGFSEIFCSDDGVSWKPSHGECFNAVSIYGSRKLESANYSGIVKLQKGKKVRVYRAYSVFAPYEGSTKREFRKTISTIDSRGFFLTVVDTEGTLDPRTVTLIRKESWVTRAKIKPIVSPIK